jgi:hypothetical protein
VAEPPVVTLEVTPRSPLASQAEQARLGAWLEYTSDSAQRTRRSAGAGSLIAGAIGMGIGVGFLVSSSPDVTSFDRGFAAALAGASGLYMSLGIVQLAKKSDSERRFDRWTNARGPALTVRELGRFEGELRSQSERADRAVRVARWTNFGFAMTGGLVLGLTPVASLSDDARRFGYIYGGVVLGVGLFAFALSFARNPETQYWERYRRGEAPPEARRWRASPAVGRNMVGAQVFGCF